MDPDNKSYNKIKNTDVDIIHFLCIKSVYEFKTMITCHGLFHFRFIPVCEYCTKNYKTKNPLNTIQL